MAIVLIGEAARGGTRGRARTLLQRVVRRVALLFALLLLLFLVPLVAVTEVSRAIGPVALRDLFLAPPGHATSWNVPAKSKGRSAS